MSNNNHYYVKIVSSKKSSSSCSIKQHLDKKQVNDKGINFKDITKSKLKKATGYSYNRRTEKGTAKKGAVITIYYCDGMDMIDIESWNGVDVSGEKGYIGNWSY